MRDFAEEDQGMAPRHVLLAALALLMVALPVGAPPQAQETIKIGYIDPLSGPFAATGENGLNQFRMAAERINKAGGVLGKKLEIVGFDNKVSPQESLVQLKKVISEGIHFVFQGNSSGVAHAISDAVRKHNERNPKDRILYLNYSAVDPALTNVIKQNKKLTKIYVIGQDYSFGKAVADAAVAMLGQKRPDVKIVGNELHPIGKVKDFSPYVQKIIASGADAVITGNWGADMINLAKAANEAGLKVPFYTYYAASDGVTAAIGAAGVDRIRLVHESPAANPKATKGAAAYYTAYKKLYPKNDVNQPRILTGLEMLAQAINRAKTTDADKVAAALEGAEYTTLNGDRVVMRKADHQLQMPIYISVHTDNNIVIDYDNSGFGLVT